MGIVSLADIIETAAEAALSKSDRFTRQRGGRTTGRWYYSYRREVELFRLYCLLSSR